MDALVLHRLLSRVRRRFGRPLPTGLILVRSPELTSLPRLLEERKLYGSSFNPAWLAELDIEPNVIVDAGSFDGGDSIRFRSVFAGATIIAIEADPDRAKIVRRNTAEFGIRVVECAIADRNGQIDWFPATIDGEPMASGSIYRMTELEAAANKNIQQARNPRSVRARTLEDLLDELRIDAVDLLHMDIQGAEYVALRGLGRIRPRAIFLEVNADYEGAKDGFAVHRLLLGMGYSLAANLYQDRLYVHAANTA